MNQRYYLITHVADISAWTQYKNEVIILVGGPLPSNCREGYMAGCFSLVREQAQAPHYCCGFKLRALPEETTEEQALIYGALARL